MACEILLSSDSVFGSLWLIASHKIKIPADLYSHNFQIHGVYCCIKIVNSCLHDLDSILQFF